jgi:hypothetical protein
MVSSLEGVAVLGSWSRAGNAAIDISGSVAKDVSVGSGFRRFDYAHVLSF